jgi:5-methylcytosine-specific restriction endonuclease McrA
MPDCLILNADYRPLSFLPLSTIPWQQAIKLSFLGRITVINYYEDWNVHSQHQAYPVPAIAVTKEYMKYKKGVRFSRKSLYLRDLYTCQYCGDVFPDRDLTIDHVIPVSRYGKTSWENCVAACKSCNGAKGNKIMQPRRLPYKPEYWHIVGEIIRNGYVTIRHPSWERYLNISSN